MYIDEEHEIECKAMLEKFSIDTELDYEDQTYCTWTLISLYAEESLKQVVDDLALKMFQNIRFKKLICLTFIANLEKYIGLLI